MTIKGLDVALSPVHGKFMRRRWPGDAGATERMASGAPSN
jgi:hypothetical protein